MNRRNAWIVIPLCLLAGLAVLAWQNSIRRHRFEHPPGRLSRQDILNRASLLKQVSLLPAGTRDTVSQEVSHSRYGRMKLFWSLDCWEAPRRYAAHAQWDADTGDLRILSRKATPPPFHLADLTRREAIVRLWRLLKQPGIGRPGEQWQLADPPVLSGAGWRLSVRSAQRRAYVQIDVHTGQVISVRLFDLPAVSPPAPSIRT